MKYLLGCLVVMWSLVAHAGIVVWGDGFMLTVQEPAGWVASSDAGWADGLPVVLFQKGSTWQNSPVVMYARLVKTSKDVTAFMATDVREFQKSCPGIRVVDAAPNAKRFICASGSAPNSEIVHYERTKPGLLIWVMSAHSEKDLDRYGVDFQHVVSSATCDVMKTH